MKNLDIDYYFSLKSFYTWKEKEFLYMRRISILFFIFKEFLKISAILCIRNIALKTKITLIKCPTLGKQNEIIAKNSPGVVLIFKIIKD